MSNLENLTAKILRDSEEEASRIIDAANAQAARTMEEVVEQANREKEKIIADTQLEAARLAEQLILGKTLAIRDENLDAKQQMLDKVFASALDKLNQMTKDEYWRFLCGCLLVLDLDGEEITLPQKYGVTSIDELNAYLAQNGKKGNLVLCADTSRTIDGGFVLAKNGIEQNNTFEALINHYRYELESVVINTLYKEGRFY